MSRAKPRSDFFRAWVASAVALAAALATLAVLVFVARVDIGGPAHWLVPMYAIAWPVYTATYVGWGYGVYSRLDAVAFRRVRAAEDRDANRPLPRLLGLTGTTNTTISAAIVAVIVTMAIAQHPDFRGAPIYIGLALLTVASSWILMVFCYAQNYSRLGAADGAHLRFDLPDAARFGDYLTFAVLISTMAATTSAQVSSREAWRVVRANVVIAFVFNSVIIAMMVSLLFGGLFA